MVLRTPTRVIHPRSTEGADARGRAVPLYATRGVARLTTDTVVQQL